MDGPEREFQDILYRATSRCGSKNIALSGGLDSTAIAFCMGGRGPSAYTMAVRDYVAPDLPYCRLAAKRMGIPLKVIRVGTGRIFEAVNETVRILGNFNGIEVRNALVMYITIKALRDGGEDSVVTGDGADELFAGYDYMLRKTGGELEAELDRISRIMHFSSVEIGRSLGVEVQTPFLDGEMVRFARGLPADRKTGERGGTRFGKMIVRRALEGRIPDDITWRKKTPMQDGSGTAVMTSFFERTIPDGIFSMMQRTAADEDGVTLRSKESMVYYQAFRRFSGSPNKGVESACPDCGHGAGPDSRSCRMCGRFPV